MNEIEPRLWIADIDAVRRGDTSRFDTVVSVCQDTAEDNVGCDYEHYKLADGLPRGHNQGECSFPLFVDAADSVVERLRDGDTVLVHCHAGRSRSAAVCVAAYAVWKGVEYHEAYRALRESRPIMNPNHVLEGFAKQFVVLNQERRDAGDS